MGVYIEKFSLDEAFANLTTPPIIANDYDTTTIEGRDKLNDALYTSYGNEPLQNIPSCDCGKLKYVVNLGKKCTTCNHICIIDTDRELEPSMWLRPLPGINTYISTIYWITLKTKLTTAGVSFLDYVTNPWYRLPSNYLRLEELNSLGIVRGYNNFCANYLDILQTLIKHKFILISSSLKLKWEFIDNLRMSKDMMFTKHYPIPSKLMYIKEVTDLGKYIDPSSILVVDAVRMVTKSTHSLIPVTTATNEKTTVKILNLLGEHYSTYYKQVGEYKNLIRKHIYGSRTHFSFRNVITPHPGKSKYDTIYIPWATAISIMKLHIHNTLRGKGYTPKSADAFIYMSMTRYNDEMDEILTNLRKNAYNGKLKVTYQRNPTLTKGSKISISFEHKKDVNDNTVSLPEGVLKALNADYDGDALNGRLQLDQWENDAFENIEPQNYVFDDNNPEEISGFLKMFGPTVSHIASTIHGGDYADCGRGWVRHDDTPTNRTT